MKKVVVIMAGGSGERFWPLSRINKPKQLLKLVSDKTMLEESIDRISELIDINDIHIITGNHLLEPIRTAIPKLPPQNVIAEPHKKNTAPCLALSASFLQAKYKNEFPPNKISVAVLTADQLIKPNFRFLKTAEAALNFVEKNNAICTIGIPPNRPETGYGYIEVNDKFDYQNDLPEIKPVVKFHEKPDNQTAKKYFESGKYLWNSGMFFWRLDTFITEMKQWLPQVGNQIEFMTEKYKNKTNVPLPEALETIADTFENFPNISIDYGLMEKTQNIYVAKALFEWDDIGSFDSLYRTKITDDNNNIVDGKIIKIDVKNSILLNTDNKNKIILTALGCDNLVVIVTNDAVLVCNKNRVQDVKKIVDELKKCGCNNWL